MKESNPQLTLLDVGAGLGTISATFAQAILEGKVTATDLNKEILPRAQAIAESAGVKNIESQQADAYKLPFADETFDITHCHQMLCHTKAPRDAVREMVRVTKLGGVVAAREGDLGSEGIWPELPALLNSHKLVVETITTTGGSSTGGRQLLSWALKAEVGRGQNTAGYGSWCYSTPADNKVWAQAMAQQVRGGRIRKAGLESGLVTENDLEAMAKAWEEWKEKDDAILGMIQGKILVQK